MIQFPNKLLCLVIDKLEIYWKLEIDNWKLMNDEQNETKKNTNNELEQCKKLCDEYLAGWQRAKADFLNYKKDETQRANELLDFAKRQLILGILPIIDNWERAVLHKPKESACLEWVKGVEMIENQLKDFLKTEGVEEIKALGEKFNPELHEAIEELENNEQESGTITEVVERGYTINNKLLRVAKVRVNK